MFLCGFVYTTKSGDTFSKGPTCHFSPVPLWCVYSFFFSFRFDLILCMCGFCLHVCAPCLHLIPVEIRNELQLETALSRQARNQSRVLWKSSRCSCQPPRLSSSCILFAFYCFVFLRQGFKKLWLFCWLTCRSHWTRTQKSVASASQVLGFKPWATKPDLPLHCFYQVPTHHTASDNLRSSFTVYCQCRDEHLTHS